MKLQRQKKRMEIKKKMVLDKIMRHEEIVALKRQQKEEAIKLKRELEIELSVERSQMRNVVVKSQESKMLAYSLKSEKKSLWFEGSEMRKSCS